MSARLWGTLAVFLGCLLFATAGGAWARGLIPTDTAEASNLLPPLAGGSEREGEVTLTLTLSHQGRGKKVVSGRLSPNPSLGFLSPLPCPDPAQAGMPDRLRSATDLRKTAHPAAGAMSWAVSGLPEIAAMSAAVTRSLETNAVVFPGVRGSIAGFLPGHDYHEIYLRDTASVLLVAPYLYPDLFLRSAVEEFLFRQWTASAFGATRRGQPAFPGPDAVFGLIAPGGWADKSTATSDEEPNLVLSAYRYARSVGDLAWLDCEVQGRSVRARIDAALEHLVTARTDPATGLVVRAHTTDWGDIRMEGDEQPTQARASGETWTISIYDQAVVYQAMRSLAELHGWAGDAAAGQRWEGRAAALKAQANRFLWQPGRGFYRTHLHVTPLKHPFDEDEIVSIANAVAVYAGLASEAQARRIFAALETARTTAGVPKPGLALFPPYPAGTFQHPNMNHWSYQNGALWDWWGAVQVTAEFLNGHSEQALAHLRALARSWQAHPGTVLEWQDPYDGSKHGSLDYAAAAGTAAEAVIRGLFGVELRAGGFTLRPRLGARDGYLQVGQPATGSALWARQRVQNGTLLLEYTAAHPGPGEMEVLLPKGMAAASVLFDSSPRGFTARQQGDDRYVTLGQVPSGTHRLDMTLRPEPPPGLSVRWEAEALPPVLPLGQAVTLPLAVRNTGGETWKSAGPGALRLRARWLDAERRASPELDALVQEFGFPREVAPGGATALHPVLRTPSREGSYVLSWELAQDGTTVASLEMPIRVTATALGQKWSGVPVEAVLRAGQEAQISLVVENMGFETWQAEGLTPVRLGARWHRGDGREVRFLGSDMPTPLPRAVPPGEAARVIAQVAAPPLPGRYLLRWDLIQEPGAWFSRVFSNPTADMVVQVVP